MYMQTIQDYNSSENLRIAVNPDFIAKDCILKMDTATVASLSGLWSHLLNFSILTATMKSSFAATCIWMRIWSAANTTNY